MKKQTIWDIYSRNHNKGSTCIHRTSYKNHLFFFFFFFMLVLVMQSFLYAESEL